MKKNNKSDAASLRKQAVERLKMKQSEVASPLSETEMLKLMQELEIHQIELEILNEELIRAKDHAELATEKYTGLYDFAPMGYFTLSRKSEIIDLNFNAAQMLGKDRSLLQNSKFNCFVSEDTIPVFNLFLEKVFTGKTKETCEVTLATKGQIPVYVHLSGIVAGKGEQCLLTMADITDRKHAEDYLRDSESKYYSIFQGSADGIMIADEETKMILFANSAQCTLLGYSEEQLRNMSVSDIHPVETFQDTLAEFGRQSRREKTLAENIQCRRKNGEIFYADINSHSVKINGKNHLVGFFRDVTERKNAKTALQKSEKAHRSLFELSVQGIVYQNSEGLIINANPAAQKILGLTLDQMQGRTSFDPNWHAIKEDGSDFPGEEHPAIVSLKTKKVIQNVIMGVFNPAEVIGRWIKIDAFPLFNDGESAPDMVYTIFEDITERKNAQDALRESENKFQAIIQSQSEGIGIVNKNEVFEFANLAAANIFETDELTGASLFDFLAAGEIEKISQQTGNRQHGISDSYELQIVTKKGNTKYLLVSSTPKFDENNNYIGAYGVFREITDRKQAENALRESEERFRTITQQSGDLIAITDKNGIITFASSASESIFLISPEEMCGKHFADFLDTSVLSKALNEFRLALTKGETTKNLEMRMKRNDGSNFFGELNGSKFQTGTHTGTLVTIRDISERKLAEAELRKFRTISDSANYGATISSVDGNFIYVNNTFACMVGWEASHLIGENFMAVHNQEQLPRVEELAALIKTKSGFTSEEVFHARKDGSTFPSLMTANVIFDENHIPLYLSATTTDISKIKQDEEILKQSEAALNYSQKIARMGSWEFNLITGKVIWSDNYYHLIGLKPDGKEVSNDAFNKIVHPDDKHLIDEKLTEIYQNRKPTSVDLRLILPDGKPKWVQNNIVPEFDGDTLITLKGVNIDITDKKLAEQKIRDLNETLEKRIIERTAQLTETNKNLENEIEKRMLIEAELELRKQRLADIIKGTNVGTWEWNIQTGETIFNERWFQIIGYTLDELSPVNIETWIGFIHPDDLIKALELQEKHFKRELDYFSLEFRMLHKNGDWIWVLNRGKVHTWTDDGKPLLMSGTHQDITERKWAEELLRESEEKYRSIFDESASAICMFDIKKNFLNVNQAGLDLLGYSLEEFLQMSISDVDADRDKVAPAQEKIMSGGRLMSYEHNLRHKNGSIVTVLNNSKPLTDDNGNIIAILSTLIDVTALRQMDQALRESETRFSLFMDYLPALVFIKDHESKLIYANNAMDTALGASKWIGLSLHETFGIETSDRIIEDDRKTLQTGYQKIEESFTNLDGKVHHYETQKFVIGAAGQNPLIGGISIDMTEHRQAEEEIMNAMDEAKKANVAKSEFLSRMSHELRTPMNSILGFAQLMNMSELALSHRKSVNYILNSGNHLLNLINEVLDISGIESGRISFSPEPVQLRGIIIEMLDVAQPSAQKRGLKTTLEYSPDNLLFVRADRQRFQQVLINLINNAVKYNSEGGSILIKTKLQQTAASEISLVRISISDAGSGIKPEDVKKLFQPFERIGADKTDIEGSGLGLMVVKNLMTAMGGTVGVESVPGEGSTFWIELPLVEFQTTGIEKNEDKEKLTAELIGANTEIPLITRTILYIEDNIPNAQLVEKIIAMHRPAIRFITSRYGKYAVTIASDCKPDCILLDLDLPDIPGNEVIRLLREEEKIKNIPVVIISADAMPQQIERLLKAGAVDYLTKPIDVASFLKMLDRFIKL
ncbi:MAG: PAS domain S-box protein [Bacteroidota bacterium]